MDFINEEDDVAFCLRHLLDDTLQPLLKLTFVFCSGEHRPHIQRVELLVLQVFRYIATDDSFGESFDDSRLSCARFTDENRVVLRTAGQYLQYTADFLVTADYRIELSCAGILDKVAGKLLQRLVVFVTALCLYLLPLSQVVDGCRHLFLCTSGIFQDPACR